MADNLDGATLGTATANVVSSTANAAAAAIASQIASSPSQTEDAKTTSSSAESNSNGNLPWAVVLLPTTSAGHSGIGQNKHGLVEESWVFGFFADGDNCQQPVIVGTIPRGSSSSSSGSSNPTDSTGQSRTSTITTGTNNLSTSESPSTSSSLPSQTSTTSTSTISNLSGASQGSSTGTPTTQTSTPFSGLSQNIQIVIETLMRPPTNFTKEQACGVVGNLIVESGKNSLNPGAIAKNDKPSSSVHPDAIGICQWNDVRAVGLKNYAASKNKDWTDLQTQVEWIGQELLNSESYACKHLKNSNDPISAADAFCLFERPKGYTKQNGCDAVPSIKQRRQKAIDTYDNINNLQGNSIRGAG